MYSKVSVFRYLEGVDICPRKEFNKAGQHLLNITSTILRQQDDCLVPCQFTFLTMDHLPAIPTDNTTRTFTFKIDPVNLLTKSYPTYTLWSFIAELGGWIGLFVGLSVPDLFDYGWAGAVYVSKWLDSTT